MSQAGKLHLLVKPGDLLLIGSDVRIYVAETKGRIRLSIEAPLDRYIELTKAYVKDASSAKLPRLD